MQPKRNQVSQAVQGPANAGSPQRGKRRRVRDYVPEGPRPRAHDRARDRGRARAMTRYVKRWRPGVDPRLPGRADQQEALEVRMGSGKGNVEYYVARIQPARLLFEMEGVTRRFAREAFPPGREQALV